MAISFQGRSGPLTKTVSRTVQNIIYDSVDIIEISYANYYFSPDKNSTPHFFEKFNEGISFYSIASTLFWNNLELDSSTQNHHYPNGWPGNLDPQIRSFYGYMGNEYPSIENYSSMFDELNSPAFTAKINRDVNNIFPKFILLSDTERKTATVPLKHISLGGISDFYKNDVLHFSLGANGVYTDSSNNILTVNVYISSINIDDAMEDLKKFHSKKSSTKVAEYQFEGPTANEWKPVSINLRGLNIPTGKCLLWFEFVRFPFFPKNPFPLSYAAWDKPLINNTWYNFEHDNTFSYRDLEPILQEEFSLEDPTEILSWYRFSHMPSSGYPARASDAAAWFYNTTTSSIEIPLNTGSYTGFISPSSARSYILESDLSSIQSDDDGLSVIIAFTTNGLGQSDPLYREYTLSAVRTAGGVVPNGGWGVVYNYRQSDELVIDSITVPHAAGWNTLGIAKIKIVKEANIVTATTNQVGTSALDPATEIIIDLDSHVDLQKFVGAVKVGVGAYSQGGASFSNISIDFTEKTFFRHGWAVNTNNVSMELNADPGQKMIGRVSGEEHENYIFETVVKSTSAQGDAIGVVIGFVFENGYEYTLSAYRSQGGPMQSKTWFAVANAAQSISFSGETLTPDLSSEVWDGSSTVSFATNSWVINSAPTMTKIRVEKSSTEVKLYTSPIGSDVIDLSTEIIIPLTGENERFKRSKIGFTSWGQPLCQWHDVHFETVVDGFTENQIVDGKLAVGGMAIESTSEQEFFGNPKSNSYFIDEYFSEKFISVNTPLAKESFNLFSGTFAEYKSSSNTTTKLLLPYEELSIGQILIHKPDKFLEKGTIGSWAGKSFLHTSTSSSLDFNPFLVKDANISVADWNGIYQSYDFSVTRENKFSIHGVTYNFERKDTIIESQPIISSRDVFNSINYQSKTHDIVEYKSGLMIMKPADNTSNIRHFNFGPPTLHPNTNSLSLNSFKDTFNKNSQFFEILKSHQFGDKKFLEITNDIMLSDSTWKESVRIVEFNFPKTVFFEYSDFLDIPNNIFYTPVLDTPFVHKVFFVNLDIPNYGFKPFVETPVTKFLIEQDYFHSTVNMSSGPKNKFKHLMIEELYRPKYRDDAQVYEFNMDIFESVSSAQFDYKKFGETFYEPITTKRPGLSGGSNAFGHDLLTIDKRQDIASNFKTFSMDEMIENSFGAAGRAGRHRDNEYREIHILDRYEYTDIDYHLDTHKTYDPNTPRTKSDETFNWVYSIDDDPSNGRIPECLKLDDDRIIGQFTDTDKFLRQYSWESWMKTQGTTDERGNFVPLLDTLDFDYEDFDLITPRQWEVNITGKSITKGTIDLIYDGIELVRGDILVQTINESTSQFEIVEKILEFDKESDRASGAPVNEVIHRYEVENLSGEIEITTLEETFTETFVSGQSTLEAEKLRFEEELPFSTGIRSSVLQKKIENLTATIAENLITNPTGYGFISKTPAGKQVNYNYVTNSSGDSFVVDDFSLSGAGAVAKFIKIIFKIRNNWSFDRDLRLFTDDSIVDTEYNSRTAWVQDQREKSRAVWNPNVNNEELDLVLVEFIKKYGTGEINIDDFISEREFILDSRDFSTPDQKTEYIEFLDTIIFKNLKSGVWHKDMDIINTLTGDYLSSLFALTDTRDRGEKFDTISQTENGEQVYKLNCSVNVDEQTFYNNIDPVQVIRGYPVYASCN